MMVVVIQEDSLAKYKTPEDSRNKKKYKEEQKKYHIIPHVCRMCAGGLETRGAD